jgi:conjugal transfer/entry exclusion protein
MTRRRRYLIGVAAGALLLGSVGTAKALIPVFDGSAIAQMLVQMAESEKAFALQVTQYALQAKQYIGEYFGWMTEYQQLITQMSTLYNDAQMLLNMAHHPTLGAAMGMMNMAGIGNSLPVNPYSVMNLLNGSSYGGGGFASLGGILSSLSGFAGVSYTQNRLYTPTDGSWASQQMIANANGIAGGEGAALAAYNDYRNHMGVLPSLRQSAASADTTKDAADVANQLLAETAWNVNQLGQSQQIAQMVQMQQQARVQRDEERLACELEMFRGTGGACPTGNNGAVAGGGGSANGGSAAMPVPPPAPLVGVGGNPLVMRPPMPVPPGQPALPPAFENTPPPPAAQGAAANPPPAQPPQQFQQGALQ